MFTTVTVDTVAARILAQHVSDVELEADIEPGTGSFPADLVDKVRDGLLEWAAENARGWDLQRLTIVQAALMKHGYLTRNFYA